MPAEKVSETRIEQQLNTKTRTTSTIFAQLPHAINFAIFHASCGEGISIRRCQIAWQARHRYLDVDIAIKFLRRGAFIPACLRWLPWAVVHDRYTFIYYVHFFVHFFVYFCLFLFIFVHFFLDILRA